nr:hypothetical protein BCU22_18800 [Vibrio cyclitrophicus]
MLFHGNIKGRLPVGGPGMVPDIMFNGESVLKDTIEGEHTMTVSIAASDGGDEVGTVQLHLTYGGAAAFNWHDDGSSWVYNDTDTNPTAAAAAYILMVAQPDYSTYHPSPTIGTQYGITDMDGALREQSTNQFHARAIVSESAVVSFPSANIPSTWSASLPITVTVQ